MRFIWCETSSGNFLRTQWSGMISLLSDCLSQLDRSAWHHIWKPGCKVQGVLQPPGLQLQHVSHVPVDRTGSAEPDTLHGSLPEARLAFGHGRWFHPLLYETGQACLSATAPQAGQNINRWPWAHHHGMHGRTPWFGTPVLFVLWEQMIQKRSPVLFTERGHFPCLSTKLYGTEPGPQ